MPCCSWSSIRGTTQRKANASASSRHDVRPRLRGKCINKVPESLRKELASLAAKPESDIDFSDLPATTEKDWRDAVRGKFYRPIKQQLTVRIDVDVIDWLKQQGTDYQSRLNAILRDAMLKTPPHR